MIEQEIKLYEEPTYPVTTYGSYRDDYKTYNLKDLLKDAQNKLKVNDIYKYTHGETYVIVKGFIQEEHELPKWNKKAVILAERISKYTPLGQITNYALSEFENGYMEKADSVPDIRNIPPVSPFIADEFYYDY